MTTSYRKSTLTALFYQSHHCNTQSHHPFHGKVKNPYPKRILLKHNRFSVIGGSGAMKENSWHIINLVKITLLLFLKLHYKAFHLEAVVLVPQRRCASCDHNYFPKKGSQKSTSILKPTGHAQTMLQYINLSPFHFPPTKLHTKTPRSKIPSQFSALKNESSPIWVIGHFVDSLLGSHGGCSTVRHYAPRTKPLSVLPYRYLGLDLPYGWLL